MKQLPRRLRLTTVAACFGLGLDIGDALVKGRFDGLNLVGVIFAVGVLIIVRQYRIEAGGAAYLNARNPALTSPALELRRIDRELRRIELQLADIDSDNTP